MFDSFTLAAAVSDLDGLGALPPAADAIEFRMDLATDPLAQLDRYEHDLPVIATNRARWEGGEAPPDGRLDLLAAAMERDVIQAIDVELATLAAGDADNVCESASSKDIAVIVSWHDFDATPSAATLEERLRAAGEAGDVGKVAVMAETPADVLPLLRATHAVSADDLAVATMSMGEPGRHSRIVAPIYGSRIGYAPPTAADATAPGQFDLATMAELIHALH